jgi:hypothetical protein
MILKKSLNKNYSDTPKGIFPTYNLLDCITTFEPTTGVAAAAFVFC